jgi:sulfite reductase alpha subunit
MIERPRMNPYVRTDDWDEEAAKWAERKAAQ